MATLLSGRWQIPLAVVAALVAGTALYRLLPEPAPVDFDAVMADIALLEQAGDTVGAADAAANLLAHDPPLPQKQRAALHEKLADLIFAAERRHDTHDPNNVAALLEHSEDARRLGGEVQPEDDLRDAYAYMWLGRIDPALDRFRKLLAADLRTDEHQKVVQAIVDLLETRPAAALERRRLLEQVLADDAIAPRYVWWALQRAVQDALDENDTLRAKALLDEHGSRLATSDLKGYLDYLRASIMVHEGRPAEAEPVVYWIDTWLGEEARATKELDDFGHLPSLNRWLMGRIHLAEQRPQDALCAFEEALQRLPTPQLRVAATVGRGLALGALNRHEAAREVFRDALREVRANPRMRQAAIEEFQQALLRLSDEQVARKDYENALDYLSLAAELTPDDQRVRKLELFDRLGRAYQMAAHNVDDAKRAQAYQQAAGNAFERAADLVDLDEEHLASLLWSAAQAFDVAGRIGDLRRVLERFVPGRSGHPAMPQALLMLGQACEGLGDLAAAERWYRQVIEDYPRLGEAARAKVLTARVFLSMGTERFDDAERLLTELITQDYVSPDAPEFRDALLTLCELLYHQKRYAEAIGRLEDFLALYPKDPELLQARFMLANAYRRSAFSLRDETPDGTPPEAALAESRARFAQAAELYGKLLELLEALPADSAAVKLYTRLALFYRGDCLFELNDPQSLQAALATYRNAAARYEGHPAALTAHVQVANTYLRLGDLAEAARALERARWLLRTIPETEFTRSSGTRAEWARFLDTVLTSELFKDVFAAAQ